MEATPYIIRTNNGGTANLQHLVRGAFQGSAIPALPLVGLGALGLGLVLVGGHAAIRNS